MAQKKKSSGGLISTNQTIADNKRAKFEYHIEDKFEAGLVLTGTEVKSLRHGQAMIAESHIAPKSGELHLLNAHIPEYQQASQQLQHEPRRPRKLLLKKREIDKLSGSVAREGYTIIPLRLYFDKNGLAKLELALAKGKQLHDKRQTEKKRDWNRQKQRIMRDKR
ncbi:MAG: SsrA-binding protein SmpB [Pseudomonadota bacterium]